MCNTCKALGNLKQFKWSFLSKQEKQFMRNDATKNASKNILREKDRSNFEVWKKQGKPL